MGANVVVTSGVEEAATLVSATLACGCDTTTADEDDASGVDARVENSVRDVDDAVEVAVGTTGGGVVAA